MVWNKGNRKYTRDQIVEFVRKYQKEYGNVPKSGDFDNNPKYPSSGTSRLCFRGNWNDILRYAGFDTRCLVGLSEEELLGALMDFESKYGIPPTQQDLTDNNNYPSYQPYIDHFGSLEKAKKLVRQDLDSMVKKGIIETTNQKGRQAEIHVLDYDKGIDLSGKNCNSFADGILNGEIYDVKSAKLYKGSWSFKLDKCVIWYHLLAYDSKRENLLYKWKIPGDFRECSITIGIENSYEFNLENMREYELKI